MPPRKRRGPFHRAILAPLIRPKPKQEPAPEPDSGPLCRCGDPEQKHAQACVVAGCGCREYRPKEVGDGRDDATR